LFSAESIQVKEKSKKSQENRKTISALIRDDEPTRRKRELEVDNSEFYRENKLVRQDFSTSLDLRAAGYRQFNFSGGEHGDHF
jgi:hypothetical protein